MQRLLRKPVTWVALIVVVAGLAVGLALFEPWRAFTSSHLDEPLPVAAETSMEPESEPEPEPASEPAAPTSEAPVPEPKPTSEAPVPEPKPTSEAPAPEPKPKPTVLAEGAFVSQEHDTSGTARVIRLPGGERILRLEGFSTSDGPDVHVWLSEATAGGEWAKYDDGRYVPLGEIKATDGNHNYAIPADADLAGLNSAVIWCDRFNVAFGSAALEL